MATDVTDEDIGKMVLYSGLNFDNGQIAERVGFSSSTVSRHLSNVEEEATADGANPEQVYWSYVMAYVFGDSFQNSVAAALSPSA